MEVVISLPFLCLPLVFPTMAGLMAISFGRKFWPWFFIGIPLPMIANVILLCLPDKIKKKPALQPVPLENENLFDHLFIPSKDDTEFSAPAQHRTVA